MAAFKISLGYKGATDSCLCINEKQYAVESTAWQLIIAVSGGGMEHTGSGQIILKIIYDNFDKDIFLSHGK